MDLLYVGNLYQSSKHPNPNKLASLCNVKWPVFYVVTKSTSITDPSHSPLKIFEDPSLQLCWQAWMMSRSSPLHRTP